MVVSHRLKGCVRVEVVGGVLGAYLAVSRGILEVLPNLAVVPQLPVDVHVNLALLGP